MKHSFIYLAVCVSVAVACSKQTLQAPVSMKTTNLLDRKVDSVLNLMTLAEKVGQLNQYNGFWDITGPTPKEGQAAKKI